MSFVTCFYAIFGPLEGTGDMNKVGRPRVPASLLVLTYCVLRFVMVETNNLSTIVLTGQPSSTALLI